MMRHALLLLAVLLTACGPIPVQDAERHCIARAYDAAGPRGEVAVGVLDGKGRARVKLGVTSDYLMGRDPSAVYNQCVYQKSGVPPTRPLYAHPDWKG